MSTPRRNSAVSDVFLNCPLDEQYEDIFHAIVFCVSHCGFSVRCALEVDDSAQVRIDKICRIMAECRYGIHDISRTDLDPGTLLPRFNMPFELGLFLGAKRYGAARQRKKRCLVLDSQEFRYQKFLSDIAGQDIKAHRNDPRTVVKVVRNWLRSASGGAHLPGGGAIWKDYLEFQRELPTFRTKLRLSHDDLTFLDYTNVVATWLRDRAAHDELQE